MSTERRQRSTSIGSNASPRWLNQRNVTVIFFVLVLIALVVFGLRRAGRASIPQIGRADPDNAAQVALGQSIYATRCASCHGANLAGTTAASALDASGPAARRSDAWLFTTIKQGGQATAAPGTTSLMPAFGGGLSDEQIWAAIAFVKSTWPAEVRTQQPQAP